MFLSLLVSILIACEVPLQEDTLSVSKPVQAIKTNALYDIFTIPSLGYEISVGKRFSLGANVHYAWWKSDMRKWFNQTYGGEAFFRWWFGSLAEDQRLSGHHLGAYMQLLTYDIEYGNYGQQSRQPDYAFGFDYGYSLPIAPHLNLDFVLGVGYLFGKYNTYLPIDTHYVWQATYYRHYFGPTKAEISLVWQIGNDHPERRAGYNKRKARRK